MIEMLKEIRWELAMQVYSCKEYYVSGGIREENDSVLYPLATV